MKKSFIALSLVTGLFIACGPTSKPPVEATAEVSLKEARKGFTTKIVKINELRDPVEEPPKALFSTVTFPSPIGNMRAYVGTIPQDGKLHPAMIWISGGWGNTIDNLCWTPQEPNNDQSAAAIREAGIVMMYPSQRGAHDNPGSDEAMYGEVDDIIAAANWLASQPGIDPKRIYLGGHSTGGTKVLLAAEYGHPFRAVFSLGPIADISGLSPENLTFDTHNKKEFEMRSPIYWLNGIASPVFAFEGTGGNYEELKSLETAAAEQKISRLHCYPLAGHDHFTVVGPACRIIGKKVAADTASQVNIAFTKEELDNL
nr:prolyl oligopeptidase family serine peptidase [uncultured Chitinophaga sp.]